MLGCIAAWTSQVFVLTKIYQKAVIEMRIDIQVTR